MNNDNNAVISRQRILVEHAKGLGENISLENGHTVYYQGEASDSVYYILKGRVKLSVVSSQGKQAVVGIAEAGDFIGENCLAGRKARLTSAVVMEPCELLRFERLGLRERLNGDPRLSALFIEHLVSRSTRLEEDVVDHLFNTSERRLARILLLLAHYGSNQPPTPIKPKVSHELLAEMVGTTRPRITEFMNKFRKFGFIEYNDSIEVHGSLLSVLLNNSEKAG
jgi:CRP/FNR family cyclic AMP-dependent transcriptional regulator